MLTVRHYGDVEAQTAAPGVTMRVVLGPKEGAPTFNLRVFELQPGASSPHHNHWWEHEVFVLSGEGVAYSEDGERPVSEGMAILVPGGVVHHFTNTGSAVLRFICLVPQEWLEGVRAQ
mgnify:FL=1